jgi:hypothetical protein
VLSPTMYPVTALEIGSMMVEKEAESGRCCWASEENMPCMENGVMAHRAKGVLLGIYHICLGGPSVSRNETNTYCKNRS